MVKLLFLRALRRYLAILTLLCKGLYILTNGKILVKNRQIFV